MAERRKTMAENKGIGGGVAILRKKAGLTQGELGEKMGLPQSTISKIERGDRNLSMCDCLLVNDTTTAFSDRLLLRYLPKQKPYKIQTAEALSLYIFYTFPKIL